MSRSDPTTMAGVALLVAALGLGGWYLVGEDAGGAAAAVPDHRPVDAPDSAGTSEKPSIPAQPDQGGEPSGAGWVRADAKEAVDRDGAAAQAGSGAGCQDRSDLIDLAKDVAGGVERELRTATNISDSEESVIGERLEKAAPHADPFQGKWDQPGDVARYGRYVQALVDSLVKHTTRPGLRYRVHVVHDKSFNAFALPGGVLAVHTGLFEGPDAVRSEAELAAVIGHEIAHIERHHPIAAYQYAKAVLGTGVDEAQLVIQMLKTPIQSEYEYEADARGLELAAQAQYDPFAVTRLWARHGASSKDEGGRGGPLAVLVGGIEKVLNSHPPAGNRCVRSVRVARELMKSLKWQRFYQGETNLQQRVIGPQQQH